MLVNIRHIPSADCMEIRPVQSRYLRKYVKHMQSLGFEHADGIACVDGFQWDEQVAAMVSRDARRQLRQRGWAECRMTPAQYGMLLGYDAELVEL